MSEPGDTIFLVRMMIGGLMIYFACSIIFGMIVGKWLELRNPMKDTEGNPDYEDRKDR
jgi:uncharacterized protein YneF (UPF0154 family)